MNRPLHVLVVEDSPTVREALLAAIPQSDPRITAEGARTLAEAVGRLVLDGAPKVDAVLLDMVLPDADGIEGVEAVTRQAPGVPVVVLTGLTRPELEEEALRAGAEDFLRKASLQYPLLIDALRKAAVRHEVRQRWRALEEEVERAHAAQEAIGRLGEALEPASKVLKAPKSPPPEK